MRITCSQCQTRFRVDDRYLTARGVRVQCPRCAHVELIKPTPVESVPWEQERPASTKQSAASPSVQKEAASPSVQKEAASPSVQKEAALPSVQKEAASPSVQKEAALPSVQKEAASPSVQKEAASPSVQKEAALPSVQKEAASPSVQKEAALPSVQKEILAEQQDDELDFSSLRSELQEEELQAESTNQEETKAERFLKPEKPSLEDWELQPTQTILGPSAVHCQSCGRVLFDSFDQALEICESCRNLPVPPPPSSPVIGESTRLSEKTEHKLPNPYALDESFFSRLEEEENLANQHTPPYAFESPFAYDANVSLQMTGYVGEEFPIKRGVWFWLRWVLVGWGVTMLFVLLFLVVFVMR